MEMTVPVCGGVDVHDQNKNEQLGRARAGVGQVHLTTP